MICSGIQMTSHTHTSNTHTHTLARAYSDILRVCVCINIQKDFACGAHFEYIWQFLQRSPSSASLFFCLIVREMRNICIYLSSRKTAECRNVISMKAEQSTAPELKSCAGTHSPAHRKVAASAQAHAQAGAEAEAETEDLWSFLFVFFSLNTLYGYKEAGLVKRIVMEIRKGT